MLKLLPLVLVITAPLGFGQAIFRSQNATATPAGIAFDQYTASAGCGGQCPSDTDTVTATFAPGAIILLEPSACADVSCATPPATTDYNTPTDSQMNTYTAITGGFCHGQGLVFGIDVGTKLFAATTVSGGSITITQTWASGKSWYGGVAVYSVANSSGIDNNSVSCTFTSATLTYTLNSAGNLSDSNELVITQASGYSAMPVLDTTPSGFTNVFGGVGSKSSGDYAITGTSGMSLSEVYTAVGGGSNNDYLGFMVGFKP